MGSASGTVPWTYARLSLLLQVYRNQVDLRAMLRGLLGKVSGTYASSIKTTRSARYSRFNRLRRK